MLLELGLELSQQHLHCWVMSWRLLGEKSLPRARVMGRNSGVSLSLEPNTCPFSAPFPQGTRKTRQSGETDRGMTGLKPVGLRRGLGAVKDWGTFLI